MTLSECIAFVDGIEQNAYTDEQKTRWVSECEGKVYAQLFLMQPYEFQPLTWADNADDALALPAPYDNIYPRYLQAMIHFANSEYDRYGDSMAVFNSAWGEVNRWFGGDFDVTDRFRNPRITIEFNPQDSTLYLLQPGCALAGGRVFVRKAYTYTEIQWVSEEELPAGDYNVYLLGGWCNFSLDTDHAAGTEIRWFDIDPTAIRVTAPDSEAERITYDSGKAESGTDLDIVTPLTIAFGGAAVKTVDLTRPGSKALPMLIGDRMGTELAAVFGNDTVWDNDGRIILTGRLLQPDEEFAYRR